MCTFQLSRLLSSVLLPPSSALRPPSSSLRPLAFAFLVPLAALAADAETTQTIRLDVVGGGALAAFLGGLMQYLVGRNRAPQRTPPLGEDVARTYATKDELTKCQGLCRKDIDEIRISIAENDKKAEDRARGTHARIDKMYLAQEKNNKAMGMLIGLMVGKGIAPASAAATLTSVED